MKKPNALLKKQTVECGDMSPIFVSKDAWTKLLTHPLILEDKTKAPLIIWGQMTDTVQLSYSGKPRCIKENLDYITVLQIDYDNGFTIPEFTERYKDYRYDLYTSYNHGFKPTPRFRAMFPLAERIYTKHICPYTRELLNEAFPGVDESCFDRCHWQVLPCVRAADAPYQYIRNQGKLLDLFPVNKFAQLASDYDTHIKLNEQIRELEKIGKPPKEKSGHAKALEWAQNQIDSVQPGARNTEFFRILNWLHSTVEADEYEVQELTFPPDMYAEVNNMIHRIWNGR